MGQSEKVRVFKNELRNYNYYVSQIDKLQESIDVCYHRLGGVRAIDYSKEPNHSLPNKELEYKLREDIERYEQKKTLTEQKIKYIDEILGRMENDVKWAVKCVYVEGKQMRNVAYKIFVGHSTLQHRIDKAIEKALE